jgi:hypothetical protein
MMAGSVLDGIFYYDSLEQTGGGPSASITRYLKAAELSQDEGLRPLWRLEVLSQHGVRRAPPLPSVPRGS